MKNMAIRTDLALEAHEMCTASVGKAEEIDGVSAKLCRYDTISVTSIEITNKNGERALGKPRGRYVTIEAPDIKYSAAVHDEVCSRLAAEIGKMAKIEKNTKTLVVGLGNNRITPDALGPEVAKRLLVTGHIKEYKEKLLGDEVSSVYAIAPGVLGTTGIESAEIIRAVAEHIHPDLVIAVDALAAKSLDRISTTIQISDAGISPGAGVGNNRKALCRDNLGVAVIAIGVPTVVDAATLVGDSAEMPEKSIGSLMVTPKDIDLVIEKTSAAVATGINLALHKGLTAEEIEGCVE